MLEVHNSSDTIAQLVEVRLTWWRDKRRDPYGHDPRSSYAEQFWLSVIGPTTTWFLRLCSDTLEQHGAQPGSAVVNLNEAARVMGVGHHSSGNGVMARTVQRACRFSAARFEGPDTLAIRYRLPLLSPTQLRRLPASQQRRHQEFVGVAAVDRSSIQGEAMARKLALTMLECGESRHSTERHLGRCGFSVRVASDALRWAAAQRCVTSSGRRGPGLQVPPLRLAPPPSVA